MAEMSAAETAALYLERNSDSLVESWIGWLRERVRTTSVVSLPESGLRNHIPPVLRSIAEYVRDPLELTRAELLGHLRLHGEIRRASLPARTLLFCRSQF
jgi:hypothetical protein